MTLEQRSDMVGNQIGEIMESWKEILLVVSGIVAIVAAIITGLWVLANWISKKFKEFEAKIEQGFKEFEAKIEQGFKEFEAKIEQKFEKIDQRFEKIEKRLDKIEKELVAIKTVLFAYGMPVPNTSVSGDDN